MQPGHTLLARAQLMLDMARKVVGLRIPANVPGGPQAREMAVNEAAFLNCVDKLVDANPPGVRWLNVMVASIVQKGRTQGVEYDDIISEIADATRQAVAAASRVEAKQAKADEPKPALIKPN